ncbi:MAG: LysR family transcriptional regulator, partial [Alphaproteobacteria bacterium]
MVLNEIGRAIEEIDALQRGVTAVLRVGAPSVTAAVVELRERLPDAVVQLIEGRVQELIHCLLQGELDYVFGAVTPELITSDMFALLKPVVLLKDELCVLASTSNQGMVGRQLKWADLQAAQWVVPP